jgi:hypothetical protein
MASDRKTRPTTRKKPRGRAQKTDWLDAYMETILGPRYAEIRRRHPR